jgi:prefoldin subunit 5
MADIREESPTLEELAAESQRIQDLAAKLLFQIDEILQEIAHRKAVEAHINEGGPDAKD